MMRKGALLITVMFAATAPAGHVSITEYGAVANDNADDTRAITSGLAAAKTRGDSLFIPAGRFNHTQFTVDGVKVCGAGNSSELFCSDPDRKLITVTGDGPSLSFFKSTTNPTGRVPGRDNLEITGASNFAIHHLTIDGSNATAIINYGGRSGIITDNVYQNTKADGIHNTDGATGIYIARNSGRNTGDDMIAVVSYGYPLCSNILIENNNVDQGNARGLSVCGGQNVTMRNNTVGRTDCAGIYISSESGWTGPEVNNILVENNNVDQAGLSIHNAGLFCYSDSKLVSNVFFRNNRIANTQLCGVVFGTVQNISWYGNTLDGDACTPSGGTSTANPNPTVTGSSLVGEAPVAVTLSRQGGRDMNRNAGVDTGRSGFQATGVTTGICDLAGRRITAPAPVRGAMLIQRTVKRIGIR